jgi:hypothetical protein
MYRLLDLLTEEYYIEGNGKTKPHNTKYVQNEHTPKNAQKRGGGTIQNEHRDYPQLRPVGLSTAMDTESSLTVNNHQTPIVPLYKKTPETTNFRKIPSPHPQVAANAAPLTAPASTPSASTLGLGGAGAPLIAAADGGSQPQGSITAIAAMPKQPVIEVPAGSTRTKQSPEQRPDQPTNDPITGAHIENFAARDENPTVNALVTRISAYFGRPVDNPWSVKEQRHFDRLLPIPEENLTVLDFLFNSGTNYEFKPRNLFWLLKNWGYVIDQARCEYRKDCHHKARLTNAESEWHTIYHAFVDQFNVIINCGNNQKERLICANSFFRLPDEVQQEFIATLTVNEQEFLTTIKEEYYAWQKTQKHTANCVS